ncbi:phage tail sheath C-terminal domain-containing protein [uncultured Litoreibacter sp.]|uniref:phage tail sheath family protein n=1 Tax=uncultured Litoreibacter sp. TaxID=1392394 RepID=UPI002626137F|nr:phage tail sheath C-terminal domain-containing protein [uncultured Litoreibacter sp.]
MNQIKTPGVYVEEKNAFPNSVVEVETAVPAFVGYTKIAKNGKIDLSGKPIRVTSMAEYEILFGGPPPLSVTQDKTDPNKLVADNRFLMHMSMQFFYDNGGGPCYIVSIGDYSATMSADDFKTGIATLETEQEPTMILAPDAVLLGSKDDYIKVPQAALAQCGKLKSRVAIIDIFNGNKAAVPGGDDPIADFRNTIGTNDLNYGMAYYPWVNTSILEPSAVDYTTLDSKARKSLATEMTAEAQAAADQATGQPKSAIPDAMTKMIAIVEKGTDASVVTKTHQAMMSASQVYKHTMTQTLEAVNLMPPSAAMAGIYTATDNSVGVWKAPANVSMVDVVSPAVSIDSEQQQDLNVPLDGLAVNAIRTFLGRGVLVWGARTLDGNSQDWRYISVRRTLIMLEQSVKAACEPYVFAANDASTWTTVEAMIENFLTNQWKAGALAGATPPEAFQVSVGLGSTMTGNDILDGYMRVTVKVAVTHPAEFIILTFQQKMQTS